MPVLRTSLSKGLRLLEYRVETMKDGLKTLGFDIKGHHFPPLRAWARRSPHIAPSHGLRIYVLLQSPAGFCFLPKPDLSCGLPSVFLGQFTLFSPVYTPIAHSNELVQIHTEPQRQRTDSCTLLFPSPCPKCRQRGFSRLSGLRVQGWGTPGSR